MLADAFGLPKMAPVMRRNDQQTGGDSETQSGNIGVAEPRATQIEGCGLRGKPTNIVVNFEEVPQCLFSWNPRGRRDFSRSFDFQADRWFRLLQEITREPPSGLEWSVPRASPTGRRLQGLKVALIGEGHVIQTLRDAPLSPAGRPVRLWLREALSQLSRAVISAVDLSDEIRDVVRENRDW